MSQIEVAQIIDQIKQAGGSTSAGRSICCQKRTGISFIAISDRSTNGYLTNTRIQTRMSNMNVFKKVMPVDEIKNNS